jgi:hypothetical protein
MRRRQNPWEAQVRDPEPASGLLDVTNRTELEDFLRSLVGGQLPASVDRKLVDVLATTAVRTVPTLHALVGNGKPPAPRVYGLALEGISAEDRDYELARQFVRFARAAADRVARTPADVAAAVEHAAREFAPELAHPAGPAGKETRMFETETQTAQYEEAEYGRRRRRRGRFDDDEYEGGGYGQGEYEAEYRDGQYEQPGYGEYEQAGYGEYEQAGYGEAEQAGYGEAEYEGEYDEAEEERFLPLIPIAGKVLGGLLGGLMKEEESEYEEGEEGEAEEEFLGRLLHEVLGPEAEHDETALSPAQEAELAGHMLQVTNEEELGRFLKGAVNTVGRAVRGIRDAANSPQGRALINAVKPLARAALPALGGAIGSAIVPGAGTLVGRALGTAASSLFETEMSMTPEQEEFETARQVVRLISAAAQNVASAPPGAPPRMVGELGVIRASRRFARPLFRRSLRRISPLARRSFGGRRGFRRGFRPGASFRRFPVRGPRFGLRPRFGYGFPVPVAEPEPAPEPPPGPPQPGFRWVAVPIGAPDPVPAAAPAEPPAEPAAAAQSEYEYSGNGHGQGGRWVRRNGKIVVLGA